MPSQVRIIAGPRNTAWDGYIQDVIDTGAWEKEHEYFGVTDPERADSIRRRLRNAGRHLGVSVKAFWRECNGCKNGGPGCRYHISYTVYDPDTARRYKARQTQQQGRSRR
jgi:hypothetical protein